MVTSDIRELGTVLSIWAHPDDEAYLVANTQDWLDDQLAQWNELGAIVGAPPTVWAGPLTRREPVNKPCYS